MVPGLRGGVLWGCLEGFPACQRLCVNLASLKEDR